MNVLTDDQLDGLEIFNMKFVAHPDFNDAVELIEKLINRSGKVKKIKSMALWGKAGVGKSSVAEYILSKHQPYERRSALHIREITPVLYCSFPSNINTKSVVKQLLSKLGYNVIRKQNEFELLIDLMTALKDCEVKIIILDETNHLLDKSGEASLQSVINFIKSLIDESEIPIVLIGSPLVEAFINRDNQIKRRIKHRKELFSLGFPHKEDDCLVRFLNGLFSEMHKDCGTRLSSSQNMLLLAQRIFIATSGYVDSIRDLLSDAIEIAMQNDSSTLKTQHLKEAFENTPPCTAINGMHPFEVSPAKIRDWSAPK